jgi:uncharacterized membrane protein
MEGKKNRPRNKKMITKTQIIFSLKLGILYVFLFLGGLWNIIGAYEYWMELLSGYVLIVVSLWAIYEHIKNTTNKNLIKHIIYFLLVFIATWLIEFVGVQIGFPFGEYSYSGKLKPILFGVPLSIGFAWVASMLASYGFINIFGITKRFHIVINAFLTGFFMMVFDIVLEPAAIVQNFWSWEDTSVPLANYLSWFIIGSIVAYPGYRYGFLKDKAEPILKHFFFAQMIFFIMSGRLVF